MQGVQGDECMPLQARREVSVNNAGASWGQAVTVMLSTKHQGDVSFTLITFGACCSEFCVLHVQACHHIVDYTLAEHTTSVLCACTGSNSSMTAAAVIAFHLLYFKKDSLVEEFLHYLGLLRSSCPVTILQSPRNKAAVWLLVRGCIACNL